MKLHELAVGDKAYVEHLTSLNALRERMLALGLTKGTKIESIRKAPGGDPTIYNIRGAMIALRKEEASCIHIVKTKETLCAAAITLEHFTQPLPLNIESPVKTTVIEIQKEKHHNILEDIDGLNISVNPE